MQRIVVLISGGGSNLQALIDACATGEIDAEIVAVVSNRQAAYGLERAKRAGIETAYFPLKPFKSAGKTRADYSAELAALVAQWQPDLIVLAGFMLILAEPFLNAFPGRIINLHPALPNTFAGTHGVERTFAAWQAGEVKHGGCMVHYAIPEVDAGEVLATAMVPILPQDSLESFAARLHRREHRLIIMGVQIALEALGGAVD